MIEKKYTVIYADPPWKYKVWSGGGAADAHYPTMNLEDIKALPVSQLAAKDCALFLWITFPMLHEAWGVMKAWGFSFRTVAFVWVKLNRVSDTLFYSNWKNESIFAVFICDNRLCTSTTGNMCQRKRKHLFST